MSTNEVLVVGGGPLGLLHALGLARDGVTVTVLDPGVERQPVVRAMVLNWSMMAGLDRLGLLDELLETGVVQTTWSLNVLRTGERIVYDLGVLAGDTAHPFTLNLEQDRFVELLLRRLAERPEATISWQTRLVSLRQDADGVTVVTSGPGGEETRRAALVVGADGSRSLVRRSLGLGFPGMTWPERFVAVNLRFDFSQLGVSEAAAQIDHRRGALIAQVDRCGLWRYLYAESVRLPEQSIPQRMAEVFADVLPDGADAGIESWAAHRMHQRVANTFCVGRVLLIGDAAHLTAPTSGLGLVGAFFDVLAATEVVGAVARGEAGDDVLERYATDRRRVFTEITGPVSSESKVLIFDGTDPERLDRDLDFYRAGAATRDSMRAFLLTAGELESPSLLRPASV
jgi:3-(3-hydroxy-phenyl)propionate hydroxylase